MKRTPLYQEHVNLGGKLIDFGGWELPVQYCGIIEEHNSTRNAAGLFDVSHMGEIFVEGKDSKEFIQKLITNDISKTRDYQVVYSPMCYPDGGVVDDLLVYKFNENTFLLVVNASNTDKDYEWIKNQVFGDVEITNVSNNYAQLAIQGPNAEAILQKLTDFNLSEIKFFNFRDNVNIQGIKALVSRTGYTGEDGFEIYLEASKSPEVWRAIIKEGQEFGLVPVGLGARDTLRLEAGLPLYGQEISNTITPIEAGLGWFVKLQKEDFIGKEAIIAIENSNTKRRLVGFEMIDRGIPRSHYEVFLEDKNIGFVTSGTFLPTFKKNMGLALVESQYANANLEFDVIIRNKPVKAAIIPTPFYSKKYKKS